MKEEVCECKHAKPTLKNSENGIYSYCLKCLKKYLPRKTNEIMTPKEKAKELVDKMNGFTFEDCMQNALRCVDEILNASPSLPILADNGSFGSDIEESTKWWQEVKTEIEKL